jgi:hypothetical protein
MVTVEREESMARGWAFDVTIRASPPARAPAAGSDHPAPAESRHRVSLSWADYEHWSHGAAPPEQVARVVVEALLEAGVPDPLPDRFDAATARRWVRDIDERIRQRL